MTCFPLTEFLISLTKADPRAIARTDPVKAARKYGISPEHAAGYMTMEAARG